VGLRPPTVVRLEGALAHSWAPVRRSGAEATCLSQNCLSQGVEPVRPAPVGRPRRNEQCGQHGHATAAVVTARPAHGTCVRPAWSNRSRRGNQARQPMHNHCEPAIVTGAAGGAGTRHAAGSPHRGKKTDGLWTTACWGPLVWVASPSAGRLPYPPACNGAPASRIGTRRTRYGSVRPGATRVTPDGGPCVHRLWMTVWTSVITGQIRR
jgi:hypothetical protein